MSVYLLGKPRQFVILNTKLRFLPTIVGFFYEIDWLTLLRFVFWVIIVVWPTLQNWVNSQNDNYFHTKSIWVKAFVISVETIYHFLKVLSLGKGHTTVIYLCQKLVWPWTLPTTTTFIQKFKNRKDIQLPWKIKFKNLKEILLLPKIVFWQKFAKK